MLDFGSIGASTVFVLMPSRSFEREGTRCEGLPETHGFLRRLRTRAAERCKQLGREVLLLAEAIQPVQEAMPYIADDELHSAFNFALTAHLFAAVAHGEVSGLHDFLTQFRELSPGCRWRCPCAITTNSGWAMAIWCLKRSSIAFVKAFPMPKGIG